jgi:hypothetical protein
MIDQQLGKHNLQATFRPLFSIVVIAIAAVAFSGCHSLRAAPAQTTPFLAHGDQLHTLDSSSPWDAAWSAKSGEIMLNKPDIRTMYIAPVNIDYLNKTKNDQGQEVVNVTLSAEDIQAMTDLLNKSFIDAIKNNPATNLRIVDQRADAMLVLEIALVELVRTKIGVNAVTDVGGLLIPGSKLIADSVAVGGQAAGGAFAGGTIAFEGRISDVKTGEVLVEFKDRETAPASILPNYRDFEEFGWSRKTVENWSSEFAQVFVVTDKGNVQAASDFSFVPW